MTERIPPLTDKDIADECRLRAELAEVVSVIRRGTFDRVRDEDRLRYLNLLRSQKGRGLRTEVADDAVHLDALWHLLPPYVGQTMRLYRGDSLLDVDNGGIGLCWTSDRIVAEDFAFAWNSDRPRGGVLLETPAPVEAIISGPVRDGVCDWEQEYVVDRRRLEVVRHLKYFKE